jgi:hypothetical protein
MELYKTIPERIKLLSETKGELQLAVEGNYTNLRIWVSRNLIYMRLDKCNAYSVPLKTENFGYLKKPHPTVQKLLKFDFETSISNLNEILEITKDMKFRQCREW